MPTRPPISATGVNLFQTYAVDSALTLALGAWLAARLLFGARSAPGAEAAPG